MVLRARLLHRLRAEAGRVSRALARWAAAADTMPPDPGPLEAGGPPEHWLAIVRARAPQLLQGRSIGVRTAGQLEASPSRRHSPARGQRSG